MTIIEEEDRLKRLNAAYYQGFIAESTYKKELCDKRSNFLYMLEDFVNEEQETGIELPPIPISKCNSFKIRVVRWIIRNKKFKRIVDPFSDTISLYDELKLRYSVQLLRQYDRVRVTIIKDNNAPIVFLVEAHLLEIRKEIQNILFKEFEDLHANCENNVSVQTITEIIQTDEPSFRRHVRKFIPGEHT